MFRATEGRWGSREIEITEVTLLDRDQQPSFIFHSGDPMSVRLKVHATHPIDDFVFGVAAVDAAGHESFVTAYVTPPRANTPVRTAQEP